MTETLKMQGKYILNPHAGYGQEKKGKIASLVKYVGGEHVIATPTPEKLEQAVAVLECEPPEYLGIIGGDGTFSTVQTALGKLNPPTLLFNGGTMNNLHTCLNLPTNWTKYVERVLKGSAGLVSIDRLKVDYKTDERYAERIGCFFGLGLAHRYLQEYYTRKKGGRLAALRTTALLIGASLFSKKRRETLFLPSRNKIIIDDEHVIDDDYNVLAVSTLPILTTGLYPFDLAAPGAMHVIIGNFTLEEILKNFFAIRKHGSQFSAKNTYYNGKAAKITVESCRSLDFVVDGDVQRSEGSIQISMTDSVRIFK
ncbi:MAG: hypothetical protein HY363_00605 [Candidatus Aenigmarchaeota archaeon]|nr:hypothetical protein [Candidatus Aenigmarchaeota archaeon]